ncbi:sugar transporter ERD6-like 7 [Rutidosis leptorrhynchoides]|uniref:sugar transporter ERD6-like 7 n=1 Tax=Rutidosis leptorrhynchoides TaxID=125765 RepID=UPI003A98E212
MTGLIPCAIHLFGLFFIPESPRWLAKTGRRKDFEEALQKLRGENADISQETAEIQEYIETLERLPKAKFLDMFERRYARSVIIGVGLMVGKQLGGINGISFYASNILEQAGFSAALGTILYAIIQVVVTGLIATVIDKTGRKPLLLVSATGLVIGSLLIAISFYLKVHVLALESVPCLAAAGIFLFIAAFSAGMGAIPWVVMSEIFPINIKGVAGGLATLVNWSGAWIVSYTFNYLMGWNSYGTFVIYAGVNALTIVFITMVVPETKGRTLEEIHEAINNFPEQRVSTSVDLLVYEACNDIVESLISLERKSFKEKKGKKKRKYGIEPGDVGKDSAETVLMDQTAHVKKLRTTLYLLKTLRTQPQLSRTS